MSSMWYKSLMALEKAELLVLDAEQIVPEFRHSSLHNAPSWGLFGMGKDIRVGGRPYEDLISDDIGKVRSVFVNAMSGIRKPVKTATAVRVGDHVYFWRDVPREKVESDVRNKIASAQASANHHLVYSVRKYIRDAIIRGLSPEDLKSVVDEEIVHHVQNS